jgi:hypothetical protein
MKPKLKTILKKKKLLRDKPELLPPKSWIERDHDVGKSKDRRMVLVQVFRLLSVSIIVILSIFLLQGFRLWGFSLPLSELQFLEKTLLGELAVMGGIIVRSLYK